MENNQATVQYFGYGTNRDHDMMVAMVGREDLQGEKAKLVGYELCIQKLEDVNDKIVPQAPAPVSARSIVKKALGEDFELYVIRPNADGETWGTVWHLTPDELKLVHEWELIEFGMQEIIKATVVTEAGKILAVDTHGLLDASAPIDRVVTGDDYQDYIVDRDNILKTAERVRQEYLERNK